MPTPGELRLVAVYLILVSPESTCLLVFMAWAPGGPLWPLMSSSTPTLAQRKFQTKSTHLDPYSHHPASHNDLWVANTSCTYIRLLQNCLTRSRIVIDVEKPLPAIQHQIRRWASSRVLAQDVVQVVGSAIGNQVLAAWTRSRQVC